MEKFQIPLSPVPPNTKILFLQQVSQSLWTGTGILKNSTGAELSLWIGIGGLEQGPNSQGNLQIRWYCLFWQNLQAS